jgi:hypothetical protein
MKLLLVLFLAVGLVSAFTQDEQDEALANADVELINFASAEVSSSFLLVMSFD